MKKSAYNKIKGVKPNQKISAYFRKLEPPKSTTPASTSKNTTEVVCVDDSDDDFVDLTVPVRKPHTRSSPRKLETDLLFTKTDDGTRVLETITNLPKCSAALSPEFSTPKKRRHESTPSPEVIPSSLKPERQYKLEGLLTMQVSKKQATEGVASNLRCKSLDKLTDKSATSSIGQLFNSTTPEKPLKQPPRRTPKKSPSRKLFEQSPSSGFKVEVMENFVRVTPSKSISPSRDARSAEAQHENEQTPPKTDPKAKQQLSFRTKLDFNETAVQKLNKSPAKCMPDDNWEEEFSDIMLQDLCTHDLDLSKLQHCKITEVCKTGIALKLIVRSTETNLTAQCNVHGFWAQLKLGIDDTVHITALYDSSNSFWYIDNAHGLIVLEPDSLIATTSIVGARFCQRRSVFKERYQGFEPSNRVMIVGILVHKLLQKSLRNRATSSSEIEQIITGIMEEKDTIWMCYESSLVPDEIHSELSGFTPRIIDFVQQYITGHDRTLDKNNWKGRIERIQDIEENIWCSQLGVKGKIDVTIQTGSTTMPLEVKTGRATVSLEHRAQVMFYIMMMNTLGYKAKSGLLLYIREGVLREIKLSENEKRDLIILRNELVYFLTRKPKVTPRIESIVHPELPEPINHRSACASCPYNTICCAYLQHDKVELHNNPLKSVQEDVLSHLQPSHLDYFVKWSSLLELEAVCTTGNKQVHEIYTVGPLKREQRGQCLSHLCIKGDVTKCGDLFEHVFGKNVSKSELVNFSTSGITTGSYVIISTNNRPAVAAGFVNDITHTTVTVNLDRNLTDRYSSETFHIDTYNSSISQTFNMTNLSLLLEASKQAERLRKIIIEKQPPSFNSMLPRKIATKGTPILRSLNKKQQKAVLKALTVNDYLLIKGMPGTGKTATIVSLIELLVRIGKTVLITSHTHSAVDNVCVRLLERGIQMLRLGNESKINPKLHSCCESVLTKNCKSLQELENVYNTANVLAVTCFGSGHSVLSKRRLDVCIVDESTQVLQCSVFRALYSADKFILIGDPDQLPPVIRNKEAVSRGLSESLFERLDSPKATITLTINYRMNKPITAMANALTYENELSIANESIANATLELPNEDAFLKSYSKYGWVIQVLDRSLDSAIKVLDTGPVMNSSKHLDDELLKCSNQHETGVVAFIVDALLTAGVANDGIGVIAPYRAQVAQLTAALSDQKVEVSTVDQFQGRDKDVIIYSCTKSCKTLATSEHEILEDKRRLTVAITRAKHKFILIGDLSTIRCYTPFAKLLQSLDQDKCFMKLENGQSGFDWNTILR